MKRCLHHCPPIAVLALLLGMMIIYPGHSWAYDSSGLGLKVLTDQQHEDLRFLLGQEPVPLIVVIRNETNIPIATGRGFSQVEVQRSLIITDPGGTRHMLSEGYEMHKMAPPFFLNQRPWGLAESLPADWVRSVTIDDLRNYIPVMKTTAGWYTIQAQQPFVRFASTGQDAGLGYLGALDHPDNWHGTVNSNKIQIYIAPPAGAEVAIRVLEDRVDSVIPLAQVPVRVFARDDMPETYNLADVWRKTEPVLRGTTNFEGWATWDSGSPCITQDDYVAVAYYANQYKENSISSDSAVGWESGCSGSVSADIHFMQPLEPVRDLFARAKSGKIDLVWTCPAGAVTYKIYRSATQGGPHVLIKSGHTSDYCVYADFGLTNGITYYYLVRWVDTSGAESPDSNEASATPTLRTRR